MNQLQSGAGLLALCALAWACGGCHPGVSNSASSSRPLASTALLAPFAIRPAAASVGEPLTCRRPPVAPVDFRWSTSDWAMEAPIFSLSKDT